jgi:transcription initiation factor IIE alpha subunit
MNQLTYLLTGKPHPIIGSGTITPPTKSKRTRKFTNKEIQFKACKEIADALHRNKKAITRSRVLEEVLNTRGGVYVNEVASNLNLCEDYVRRMLKDLEKEGLVVSHKMCPTRSGGVYTLWRLNNAR